LLGLDDGGLQDTLTLLINTGSAIGDQAIGSDARITAS
jgi:hypothetical protein